MNKTKLRPSVLILLICFIVYIFGNIITAVIYYIDTKDITSDGLGSITFGAIVLIGMIIGTKKAKKETINDINFSKKELYYRDVVRQYSPATLSYIDNFELNYKDIIASLLNLQLKNYINIADNKIEILNIEWRFF